MKWQRILAAVAPVVARFAAVALVSGLVAAGLLPAAVLDAVRAQAAALLGS